MDFAYVANYIYGRERLYALFATGIIAQDEQGEWDFWDRDVPTFTMEKIPIQVRMWKLKLNK
jgi:hypothetical protein